jgi:hypothetical protein
MKIFKMISLCIVTWAIIYLSSNCVFKNIDNFLYVNLNPNKCAFMEFSRMIIEFIDFKEEKLPNLKKISVTINMPIPTNPQHIQVLNGMA